MDQGQIYVNSNAMISWKEEMKSLNSSCAQKIDTINDCMNTLLSDQFQGDYATSFKNSITNFATTVKNGHEAMGNVEQFLNDICEIMNKE